MSLKLAIPKAGVDGEIQQVHQQIDQHKQRAYQQ